MTPAFTRVKSRLANWREREMNPVLVKELRQAVRSRALTGTLLLLLAALFLTSLAFFTEESFTAAGNQQLGLPIFRAFLVILTAASFLFIPLYVGIRLAAERQESDLDLMFITSLGPRRIIRGKLFCGAYLAMMFFSACMPFMTFTNFLRGVDLPTIFFILFCLYGADCLAIQAAIFFACLPFHRVFKIFVGMLFTCGLCAAGGMLIGFFFSVLTSGVGAVMEKSSSWFGFFVVVVMITGAVQWFHAMSVSLIAPNQAGRFYNQSVEKGIQ